MKLKCPACHADFSLDAALGIEAGRSALLQALKMPALGSLWPAYLAMFRAAGRSLSFARVENLLRELQPMLDAQSISRNGVTRRCPLALWQQALERMVEARDAGKLTLPLKSHGYLLEIVYALAEAAGAQEEKAREAAMRTGATRAQGDERLRRQFVISSARGDVELGLATLDEAKQRLREAGIDPNVLEARG